MFYHFLLTLLLKLVIGHNMIIKIVLVLGFMLIRILVFTYVKHLTNRTYKYLDIINFTN